jgi:xylulokinase
VLEDQMPNDGEKYILAIDLGTSAAKVALISTGGQVVAYDSEETPVLFLPNGGAEQRPDDWWQAIKTATQRIIARDTVDVADIVALNCTTQWSGTVAVDEDGQPLANAIIWMDSRGMPHIRRIADGLAKVEGYSIWKLLRWIRLTGGAPSLTGKDPIAHILYIKHELPQIYEATYKFLEPKDYLNLCLTGRFAASHDSITLHWVADSRDIQNVAYDDRLLEMSQVERHRLPDLRPANEILGPIKPEVARTLGLPEHVQVVIGTPDIHSAAIGSGAVRDYEAHLYIGTSSWLVCHVPFKKTDLSHKIASIPSAIPGRYLATNEQETSGACLTFLRDNILFHEDELCADKGPSDVYRIFDRIAERVPAGSGRLIFSPWLYGERAPVDDSYLRASLHNLSINTTREHIIRAVFEGVAYNSRWLLGYVEKFIKRRLDAINLIGGGANSDIWCQIHADVLGRTIRQVQDPIQANLRGAALLASVAMGYLTYDDIPDRVQIANTYTPNPNNRAIYDDLFNEFIGIYKRDKKLYARLNRPT